MILEAFSTYLHAADPRVPAVDVLSKWLVETLSRPAITNVEKVIHCEMAMFETRGDAKRKPLSKRKHSDLPTPKKWDSSAYAFKGKSAEGQQLLRSLYEYCQSYDAQKWARFLHKLKASDFDKHIVGNSDHPLDR